MKGDVLPLATDEDGESAQSKKQASAKERRMAREREERLAKLAEWKVNFPCLSLFLCVCVCVSFACTCHHIFYTSTRKYTKPKQAALYVCVCACMHKCGVFV